MEVEYRFTDKNFVVMGASTGMGKVIAAELAMAGANVLAIARRREKLQELQEAHEAHIHIGVADVRNSGALTECLRGFTETCGKLHGAVYTAGIAGMTPLRAFDEGLAQEIMDVSFWGAVHAMQLVNRRAFSAPGCSSVLFSSVAAHTGKNGMFAYAAAKAAIQAAVRSMAKEISRDAKRINTVSPGWVETEMTKGSVEATGLPDAVLARHLLGIGRPEDVSGMVLFLLSDRARWITGADFVIDGGYLQGGT